MGRKKKKPAEAGVDEMQESFEGMEETEAEAEVPPYMDDSKQVEEQCLDPEVPGKYRKFQKGK
jgi:hypothetical protein